MIECVTVSFSVLFNANYILIESKLNLLITQHNNNLILFIPENPLSTSRQHRETTELQDKSDI